MIGVVREKAEELLELPKGTEEGSEAKIIGEARRIFEGVAMQTVVGGKRIIVTLIGDPIPRIWQPLLRVSLLFLPEFCVYPPFTVVTRFR